MKTIKVVLTAVLLSSSLLAETLKDAITKKLEHCGLHLSGDVLGDPFGAVQAAVGHVNLVMARSELTNTDSLLAWSRQLPPSDAKEEYRSVLNVHQSNVKDAIEELTTNRLKDLFAKDANAKQKPADVSKIPEPPCHTSAIIQTKGK